jgi:hypothetical protein
MSGPLTFICVLETNLMAAAGFYSKVDRVTLSLPQQSRMGSWGFVSAIDSNG